MNELSLCPLCAGEALLETVEAHQHTIAKFMPDYPGGAIAQCLKCSLAIMREGPDAVAEVTAAWNTRAELRALGGGWLPIESAPKDRSLILVALSDGRVRMARWSAQNKMWLIFWDANYSSTHRFVQPVSWQPLPPSPAATVEG